MLSTPVNEFCFHVGDTFEEVPTRLNDDGEVEADPNKQSLLSLPANLGVVLLCENWWDREYSPADFTGKTVEEVIRYILHFYGTRRARRGLGDHVFFEGFSEVGNDVMINLGS